MARPQIEIDGTEVEKLAALGATVAEIADFMGCSKDVIERRFQAEVSKGRVGLKINLRRTMVQAAIDTKNITMMIWLSKQFLGMKEPKQEIDFSTGVDGIDFTDDQT